MKDKKYNKQSFLNVIKSIFVAFHLLLMRGRVLTLGGQSVTINFIS